MLEVFLTRCTLFGLCPQAAPYYCLTVSLFLMACCDHRAQPSLTSQVYGHSFLFFAPCGLIIPAQTARSLCPWQKGHFEVGGWGLLGKEGGFTEVLRRESAMNSLRATVMSNGTCLWEPSSGGPFVVKHERVATYHCAFSHQPASPIGILFYPATPPPPTPGQRWHIPGSINRWQEKKKWSVQRWPKLQD